MDNSWISIEEGPLPESREDVLLCNEYDDWVSIGFRIKTNWYDIRDSGNRTVGVRIIPTHWMKCPKPFKNKDNND